jgi:hypothetical protein
LLSGGKVWFFPEDKTLEDHVMRIRKAVSGFVLCTVLAPFGAGAGDACLYGSATNSDGSKIDGTARVSTSWNGKEAYPRKGNYELCLGSNPEKRITVYLDGNSYAEPYVDGNTRLDIVRR